MGCLFIAFTVNDCLADFNILGSLFPENTVQVVPFFWHLLCSFRCKSFFFLIISSYNTVGIFDLHI